MTYTAKAILLSLSALVMAQSSLASTVSWSLNGVTFSDGATATGSFDWDADSETLSNWNINVSAGVLSDFTYTPTDTSSGTYFQIDGYEKTYVFRANDSTRELRITPVTALTDAEGTVDINLDTWGGGSGSVECFNCEPYRSIVSGSLTGMESTSTNAPEPASIGLLGLGLIAPVLLVRKR